MTQDPAPTRPLPGEPFSEPGDSGSGAAEQVSGRAVPEKTGAAALREARYEAQHARKLALAILSTLQHKGLLTDREVDSILLAAKRAAEASVPAQAVRSSFGPVSGLGGAQAEGQLPAAPPVFDIQVDE